LIDQRCFTKEWINGFRKNKIYSKINPPILEKMINALSLLEHLVINNLVFVFKGGTSLILLLENTNRFSVDIDILTTQNRNLIEQIFDKIIETSHFLKWKLDERRSYKSGIPKAHYEFEFKSVFSERRNTILLDILFEKPKYPKIQLLPIKAEWIGNKSVGSTKNITDIFVNVPTIESIMGDKLTAFAPTTTGILFNSGKELEIIKQLYDIDKLFDKIENLKTVSESFQIFARQEIEYRNLDITPNDVLDDIFTTSRLISMREKNGNAFQKKYFNEIQIGLRSFSNFLISGSFRIENAINAAAKAAYLSTKLKLNDLSPIEKFSNQKVAELNINTSKWSYLNKLKKLPDKSGFFYWYKTIKLLDMYGFGGK